MRQTRILIVDDSKIDRIILRRAFDKANITAVEIEEATDAHSALERLTAETYDAVILDVNMPGENGFYVLKELRQVHPRTWPFVFMFSSSDHPDDVTQAYDGGATAYLCKPFEFDEVKELMQGCMNLIRRASMPEPAPRLL